MVYAIVTLFRCYGRLRGGAQRYRQPPQDISGQRTCSGCGQERVWPTRQRCFRCGEPRDHDPHPQNNFIVGPTGRPPQRTAPTNPHLPAKSAPETKFRISMPLLQQRRNSSRLCPSNSKLMMRARETLPLHLPLECEWICSWTS